MTRNTPLAGKHDPFSITVCAVALTLCWGTAHAGGQTNIYDSLGRLNQVRTSDGVLTSYDYDPAGNRTQKRIQTVSQSMRAWEGENLPHVVGYADGEGWAASVSSSSGTLVFGPYTTAIPAGNHIAVWKMLVDNNTVDERPVVTIDVNDYATGKLLAQTTVFRNAWKNANSYEYFGLPFVVEPSAVGHALEIRVTYIGASYMRVDKIGYQ
jgi:YD repeat-containing protein